MSRISKSRILSNSISITPMYALILCLMQPLKSSSNRICQMIGSFGLISASVFITAYFQRSRNPVLLSILGIVTISLWCLLSLSMQLNAIIEKLETRALSPDIVLGIASFCFAFLVPFLTWELKVFKVIIAAHLDTRNETYRLVGVMVCGLLAIEFAVVSACCIRRAYLAALTDVI